MSTKNKKNLASQALLEMDAITSAIKEESKNTLNTLLAEAVRNALREGCEEEEDKEYDVVDDEQNDAEENENETDDAAKTDVDEDGDVEMDGQAAPAQQQAPQEPMGAEAAPQDAPVDGEGNEGWDEFSEYQAGDNTYDLTGENDYEKVVKVYKLLKDDDQVVVKKDGNAIHLSDANAGTEYVIDLGTEGEEPEAAAAEGEEMPNPEMNLNESDEFFDDEFDMEGGDDDIAGFGGSVENNELDDIQATIDALQQKLDSMKGDTMGGEVNNVFENRKTRKPMKESKEVLFEVDLGYTDNYQDKDPIAGLSNNEPSKGGKSWHKGVPTGTKKPWAGETKSKGQPFEKTVNEEDEMGDMPMEAPINEAISPALLAMIPQLIEYLPEIMKASPEFLNAVKNFMPQIPGLGSKPMEEGAMSTSSQSMAKETKTRTSGPRRDNARQNSKNVSTAQHGYEEIVNENKKLKKQVKDLKEAVLAIRKNLSEAYVTNANLGKITKLFLENTTSQAEKVDIVNRFSNEAKTIEQSKALYESIKRELNKTNPTLNINESVTANGSKVLNEDKVYKSDDLIKTIDFMNRVMNC